MDQNHAAPKSKMQRFEIKEEGESKQEHRVVKLQVPDVPAVKEFEFTRIKKAGDGDYQHTKKKYGALAATDTDRKKTNVKDARFSLNSLLREPLSVDQEEARVIEERVQGRVRAVAEEAKQAAAAVGYRDGLAKGHEEAFLKFQQDAKDRLAMFDLLLKESEQAKQDIFKANERFLVELVYRIAKMVLLRELKTDRGYIQRLAEEVIERLGVRENIKLRINPRDAETIGSLKEDLEKSLGALQNLSVEISNQVPAGGCHVETQFNAIEANIDQILHGIGESLLGKAETETAS